MVRTILCQPVSEARVFSDEYEPTAVCCTSNGFLLLASNWGVIHVYDIDQSGCPRIHKFASNGIPDKLIYCEYGGYVVSLENKLHDFKAGIRPNSNQYRQVRIYLNWLERPDQNDKYLISHRIGYSESNLVISNYVDKFLILDIPLKPSTTVTDVTCCNLTGNICLATENKIFIYRYKEIQILDSPGKVAMDFEIVIEIDCGFQACYVTICGDYIAFASLTELRVIQVFLSGDEQDKIYQAEDVCQFLDDTNSSSTPSQSQSSAPVITELKANVDEHFVIWNIDQACAQSSEGLEDEAHVVTNRRNNASTSTFGSPTYVLKSSAVTFEAIKDEPVYIDNETTSKQVLGPKATLPGHPLKVIRITGDAECGTHESNMAEFSVTLLYRRFQTEQLFNFGQEGKGLHSVQWIPVFAKGSTADESYHENSAQSLFGALRDRTLISLGLFISTSREGFLYEMLNSPSQLAVYAYTGDCLSTHVSSKFLFAITNNGLETYTVRLYSSAAETCANLAKEGALGDILSFNRRTDQNRALSLLSTSALQFITPKGSIEDEMQEDFQFEVQEEYYSNHSDATLSGNDSASKGDVSVKDAKKKSSRKSIKKERKAKSKAGKYKRSEEWTAVEKSVAELNLFDVDKKKSRWPSSVYHVRELLKPCPSSSVEICLIGLYQLRELSYLGCSDKHVILLVKALEIKGKRGSVGKDRSLPWNIYMLEIASAVDLHNEIMCLIEGSEFVNPDVYHQLLSEAHLCLRSELTYKINDDKKSTLKFAIRRSAARLGDFFARCSNQFDWPMATNYYSLACQPFEDILKRNLQRDLEDKLDKEYGLGMTEYLNCFMFAEDRDPLELSKENAEHIFRIYKVAQPSLLSKVILKSRLKNISPESAVEILEELKSEEKETESYSLSPTDYVTLAILHLKLCNPDHSELMLKQLKAEQLTQVCCTYPNIIWENDNTLTTFGQLLQRHFSLVFSDILVVFHDKGITGMQTALGSFGLSPNAADSQNYSLRACQYLESILNDKKREIHFSEAMDPLLHQYINCLKQNVPTDFLKIPHRHLPKGSGHFSPRFEWLNMLPPFAGEIPSPVDCVFRKPSLMGASQESQISEDSPGGEYRKTFMCSCCCCNSIILKLQSLLSSRFIQLKTCETLLNFIEEYPCVSADAIKLLCYPKTDQTEKAVRFLVKRYPSLILLYGKDAFENNKSQWQLLLKCLLETLKTNDYEQWNQDTYLEALKGTLMRLAKLCTPTEFVDLIPSDGTLRFFLPYVRDCCHVHNSVLLRNDILQSYAPINTT